jgi:formamidopyrimidine-DNA glycosylase
MEELLMPELPEVETIREGLEKKVKGKRVSKVIIKSEKSIKAPSSPGEFIRKIEGRILSEIRRRGKYLILELDSKDSLIIHLKMTGRLIYSSEGEELPYTRVILLFPDKSQLSFTDMRRFGGLWLISDEEFSNVPFLKSLGPEPLQNDFTLDRFRELLKGKKGKIKSLLMEQTFIAGVGNIYSQEALFLARIHPEKNPSTFVDSEIEALYSSLLAILREATSCGGSSVDTYVNLNGKKGDYVSRLRVYGRQDRSCSRCGAVIKKIKVSGRGTCFCPLCQK